MTNLFNELHKEEFSKALNSKNNKILEETVIFQILKIILDENTKSFHKTLSAGTQLFRCRELDGHKGNKYSEDGITVTKDGSGKFISTGFDSYNSKENPFGKFGAGRVNLSGMAYLYLAEEEYTACAEIKPLNETLISLATFELKKDVSVIDLKTDTSYSEFLELAEKTHVDMKELLTWIMRRFCIPVKDSEDYYITQVISDYIRRAGYDGIRFQSAMSGGTNVTLFNCHESYVQFVSSRLVCVPETQIRILDLNSGNRIKNPNSSKLSDDEEIENTRNLLLNKLK